MSRYPKKNVPHFEKRTHEVEAKNQASSKEHAKHVKCTM